LSNDQLLPKSFAFIPHWDRGIAEAPEVLDVWRELAKVTRPMTFESTPVLPTSSI